MLNEKKIKLQITDTAGAETYNSITMTCCRRANGIILMYDIANRNTFESLEYLFTSIKEENPNISVILVGNMCDLEDKRKVSLQEGEEFAKTIGVKFIEISGKKNINVDKAFNLLIEEMIENDIQNNINKKIGKAEKEIKHKNEKIKTKKKGIQHELNNKNKIIEKKDIQDNILQKREIFLNNKGNNCLFKYESF